MDHVTARALADADMMPHAEYVRLCRLHGWVGPRARPALRLIAGNA